MINKKYEIITLLVVIFGLLFAACAGESEDPGMEESTPTSASPAETAEPETSAPATDPDNALVTAVLSELEGLVEMKQAGEDAFSAAQADSILELNGQVQTGDDGKVRLDLSSGTIVRVSPSSLFTLVSNEETEDGLITKLQLSLGRIFVILNGGSLEVETPSGVASVRGSYLMNEFNPETGTFTLTCLEGDCSYVSPTGETVDYTDGEKVEISQDPTTGEWVVVKGPMTTGDFQLWFENSPEAQSLVDAALSSSTAETGGDEDCMGILGPSSDSDYGAFGPVEFEWEPQAGADYYIVEFTLPTDPPKLIQFRSDDTSMTRYIENLPPGGGYSWNVTAYGSDGTAICTSASQEFTKEDTDQFYEEMKKKKELRDDNGDDSDCDPCDTYGGCFDPLACGGS